MSENTEKPRSVVQPITAAAAIEQINIWADISAQKRRELVSAINVCGRIAGIPLGTLPLTPQVLRPRVVTKSLAIWEMSAASRSNTLSRLRFVLAQLGVIDVPAKDLAAEWLALVPLLDDRMRMSLSTFMVFLSARDIPPTDVRDDHLTEYETWLTERTIYGEPRTLVTATRRAWNKAAKSVEGWPKTTLALDSLRDQPLLPFSVCPESFGKDVEAYRQNVSGQNVDELFGIAIDANGRGPDAFDLLVQQPDRGSRGGSNPMILRPLTVDSNLQLIKIAFNALHRSGVPLSEITSLVTLVTPLAHPKQIIQQLLKENGGVTRPRTAHVMELLRQLAKYHVNCPPEHIAQMAQWTAKVRVAYDDMTPRNRRMLAEICTSARLGTLLKLPEALMAEADELGPIFRGAVAARRAAMLLLLTRMPMRLANLMMLRLDEHLIHPDPRTGRISAIFIKAEETKNRVTLTYPVSAGTSEILQRWITEFRPLITAPGNYYLFGGKGDQPMTRAGIRDSVKAITVDRVGVEINPHLFRHIAGAIFLQANPGGFEDVRRLLGHKSLRTTTRSYTGLQNEASVVRFDKILNDLTDTMGAKPRPKKKRSPKPAAKRAAKRPAGKTGRGK